MKKKHHAPKAVEKKASKEVHKHAKAAHKIHKEILKHHSKLMDGHAKMEKHLRKMAGGGNAGGAQISTGKPNERSRPNKAETIAMDEGRTRKKVSAGY
jgi:hypothetical protein